MENNDVDSRFMKIHLFFFLVLIVASSFSCKPSRKEDGGNASSLDRERSSESVDGETNIPKGYIDASEISVGELSKIFRNRVKEAILVEKFGEPATRTESERGQILIRYHFFNAGRESGDPGFYVDGLFVVFSPTGQLVLWEITYEQLFDVGQ